MQHLFVLILIILEYIYMVEKKEELYETLVCLNPYYTGIHLHGIGLYVIGFPKES